MEQCSIVVVGASAGGFAVLRDLAAGLPPDLPAALFIVWHLPADSYGILPDVLGRAGPLPAAHAVDGEPITPGRIYVAPPDHHLLLARGHVRVTKGPRENRFRPAVDPLFRSAAYAYGPLVIGVVLSGALDDGAAGARAIKRRGGIVVVQSPLDAEVPSMPHSAMRAAPVDHVAPAAELAPLLARLGHALAAAPPEVMMDDDEQTNIEMRIAAGEHPMAAGVMKLGSLTPYTCPECHGVLLAVRDGPLRRFRCHTGHAFSADTLLDAVTATAADQLWIAVRGLQENHMLLNHLGDHFAEANQPALAALYYQQANAVSSQAQLVRQALDQHVLLSAERLRQEAAEQGDDEAAD